MKKDLEFLSYWKNLTAYSGIKICVIFFVLIPFLSFAVNLQILPQDSASMSGIIFVSEGTVVFGSENITLKEYKSTATTISITKTPKVLKMPVLSSQAIKEEKKKVVESYAVKYPKTEITVDFLGSTGSNSVLHLKIQVLGSAVVSSSHNEKFSTVLVVDFKIQRLYSAQLKKQKIDTAFSYLCLSNRRSTCLRAPPALS